MFKSIKFLMTGTLIAVIFLTSIGCATSVRGNGVSSPIDRISEAELERLAPKPVAVLTLGDIVKLSQEGQSAEQIIEKIRLSNSQYELTPSQSVALNQQGVHGKVLDYIHASRELAWRNSMADEISKREKEKNEALEKLKRQQLERRSYEPFCRGYYGLHPYGYGAYGSRFGSRFGIGAGYVWPRYCW